MKRLKVDTLQPPADPGSAVTSERMYTVHLGHGGLLRFSSRRHALAAQAEASRQLTELMFTANLMLTEAFGLYRLAWPYLPAGDAHGRWLRDGWDQLERAATVNGPNAVVFRWRSIDAALSAIRSVAMGLVKLYVGKTHAVPKHQAEQLATRCGQLLQQLRTYGMDLDTATSIRPPR